MDCRSARRAEADPWLGAFLRIADASTAATSASVGSVKARGLERGSFDAPSRRNRTFIPEIEAAMFKADMFERAFGVEISFEIETARAARPTFGR